MGCGGGSSKKSGLKKNDYLGSLPALYADYELAKKADNKKIDKLHETGNLNKIMKEVAKIEKEAKERDAKHRADVKAEIEKIKGKDIPFTCSEAFKKLNCDVTSLKIKSGDDLGVSFIAPIVAKSDFVVSYKNKNDDDYEYVYYRVVAKDGSTIDTHSFFIFLMWGQGPSFTAGQLMRSGDVEATSYFPFSKKSEKWADFAGIEFITREEYNNLK